jgi:hypothetical protein
MEALIFDIPGNPEGSRCSVGRALNVGPGVGVVVGWILGLRYDLV